MWFPSKSRFADAREDEGEEQGGGGDGGGERKVESHGNPVMTIQLCNVLRGNTEISQAYFLIRSWL